MNYFNLDTVLKHVLPRLLTMTMVSFVLGGIVGAVVGWLATLIWQRRQQDKNPSYSKRWLIKPAIFGSFIGMLLIGLLPIAANPDTFIADPFWRLWFLIMFMMLGPLGSISGAILGAVIGAKQSSYMGRPKLIGIVLLTYLLCASILYSDNGQQLAIAYCLGSVFILVAALGKPVPWLGMMSLLRLSALKKLRLNLVAL